MMLTVIAGADTVAGHSEAPGYLAGYGVIDAAHIRELAQAASVRPVECPAVSVAEALRYRPSAALERWIRCRDVTCRFPGCDRSAWICDVDHTEPFNHDDPFSGLSPGGRHRSRRRPSQGRRRPSRAAAAHPRAAAAHPRAAAAHPRRREVIHINVGDVALTVDYYLTALASPSRQEIANRNGATTCAGPCRCSKAANPAPAPGAPCSTTPSNPNTSTEATTRPRTDDEPPL